MRDDFNWAQDDMQKMLDLLNDVHFFRATDTTARYNLVVVSRAVRTNFFSQTLLWANPSAQIPVGLCPHLPVSAHIQVSAPSSLFNKLLGLVLPETRQASHQWQDRLTTMSTCSTESATATTSSTFSRLNSPKSYLSVHLTTC